MQRFFCGPNLLTRGLGKDLCFGSDNILRVLWVGPEDRHYTRDKLSAARNRIEEFRKRKALGFELSEISQNEKKYIYMRQLIVSVLEMIERPQGFSGRAAWVVQQDIAPPNLGREQHNPKKTHPKLTASLHGGYELAYAYG